MKRIAARSLVTLGACVALATIAASQWLMFRAGCTGDVKGGAFGNPSLALEKESQAIFVEIIGVLMLSGLIAYLFRGKRGGPATYGVIIFVFALVALWFAGIEVETQGLLSCS